MTAGSLLDALTTASTRQRGGPRSDNALEMFLNGESEIDPRLQSQQWGLPNRFSAPGYQPFRFGATPSLVANAGDAQWPTPNYTGAVGRAGLGAGNLMSGDDAGMDLGGFMGGHPARFWDTRDYYTPDFAPKDYQYPAYQNLWKEQGLGDGSPVVMNDPGSLANMTKVADASGAIPAQKNGFSGVTPALQALVSRASEISSIPFGMYPSGGKRTQEEQTALQAAGWSKQAKGMHLDGNAIDLIPIVNGQPDPNDKDAYAAINAAMTQASQELGVPVTWGGSWKSFPDNPHYQVSPQVAASFKADPNATYAPPQSLDFSPAEKYELGKAGYPGVQAPSESELFSSLEQQYNLPSGYLTGSYGIESNYGQNLGVSSAGARGPFQFTSGTAKQYGLVNPNSLAASAEATARYAADNAQQLQAALGRPATAGELYLAHQQGAAGAISLLTNPDQPAASAVGFQAVAQNLPADMRGKAAQMTAGDFANFWSGQFTQKAAGIGASYGISGSPADYATGGQRYDPLTGALADSGELPAQTATVARHVGIMPAKVAAATPVAEPAAKVIKASYGPPAVAAPANLTGSVMPSAKLGASASGEIPIQVGRSQLPGGGPPAGSLPPGIATTGVGDLGAAATSEVPVQVGRSQMPGGGPPAMPAPAQVARSQMPGGPPAAVQMPLPTPRPTPPAELAEAPSLGTTVSRPAAVNTGNALGDRMLNAILSQNPLELSAIGNDYTSGNPATFGAPGTQMMHGLAAMNAVKSYLDANPDVASQVKGILQSDPMTPDARKGMTSLVGELPGKATPPQIPLTSASPTILPTPRPEHVEEPAGVSAWGLPPTDTNGASAFTGSSSSGFFSGAKPATRSVSPISWGGSQPISVSVPHPKAEVTPPAETAAEPSLVKALASTYALGGKQYDPLTGALGGVGAFSDPGAMPVGVGTAGTMRVAAPAGIKIAPPAPKAVTPQKIYQHGPVAGALVPPSGTASGVNAFSAILPSLAQVATAARSSGYTTGVASPGYLSNPTVQQALAHGYTAPNFSSGSGGAIYAYHPDGQGGGTYVNSFGQTMTY